MATISSLHPSVLDAMTDGVIVCDDNGVIVLANRAAARMLGRARTELHGVRLDDDAWEAEGADGQPLGPATSPTYSTLRTGRPVKDRLVSIKGEGGERVWLSVSTALLDLDADEPEIDHLDDPMGRGGSAEAAAGVIVVLSDHSARRRAELALNQQNSGSADWEEPRTAITRHDGEGRIEFAGHAAAAVLHRDPAELVGRTLGSISHAHDRWSVSGRVRDVLAGRGPATLRWRLNLQRGAVRWIETRLAPIADPSSGAPAGVMGFSHDVTEAHEAGLALAASEDRFRAAFDASPIGMSIISANGDILQVNRAACVMTGYREEELCRLNAMDLSTEADTDAIGDAYHRLFDLGESQLCMEKQFVRSDGEVRWDEVHITVIERRNDRPHRLLVQSVDVTERREVDARLRFLADHDPLTGLLNRRSFERALTDHIRSQPNDHRGAVLVLDLDHFKYVNDSLGHHIGDQLIVTVAHRLAGCLGDQATVARLGGDEFAVLLPTGGALEARVVAETLIDAIREMHVALRGGSRRRVTTSVGIALFDGAASPSADELLVAADLAMYDAKEDGRNRWAIASAAADGTGRTRTRGRVGWVERIERALEEDAFELFAQPIIDLRSGQIDQYELLLRMRDANGGLILPGEFLAVAERLDLVQAIDRWVTDRAITQLAAVKAAGRSVTLEVNLSGRSLNDATLLELISRRVGETGIDPASLVFEITETAAVRDIGAARSLANSLADLGCRFALDDFGAGFGSFYYLKYLPFDFLKIDGEFVLSCTTDNTDKTIIRALVDVARQLGKCTVAEFTSDANTLDFLSREGVDYAQGFHVGRPEPLEQALARVRGPLAGSNWVDLSRDDLLIP